VAWFPDRPWLQIYLGLYPVGEALLAQALVAAFLAVPVFGFIMRRKPA